MTDRTTRVRLTGDASSYEGAMRRSATATEKLQQKIASTNKTMGQARDAQGRFVTGQGQSTRATQQHTTATGQGRDALGRFTEGQNKATQSSWNLAKGLGFASSQQQKFGATGKIALGVMSRYVGATAIVAGVGAAFAHLGSEIIGFDTNMRNVQSLTHDTDADLERLGDRVLSLSDRLPQSASDLADGLYEIESSGFAGARGVTVLNASAQAAAAGLTTTGIAAKGITAVLNAYGLGAEKAADVSDVLFQTVNLGVIRFDELSAQLGDFVGTAATLGVPIDDASAALATMTLNGINAAESSTSLNRVMLALIKPSESMGQALKKMGYETGVSAVHALGLRGVIEALRKETGGSVEAFAALFPEVRGLRGALALTSNEGRTYARVQRGISDENERHRATARALAEQQKSLSYQFKVTWNGITNDVIRGSRAIVPALARGLAELREFGGDVAELGDRIADELGPGIESIGDVLDDLGPILDSIGDGLESVADPAIAAAVGLLAVAFNTAAGGAEMLSSFLAENRLLVQLLAAVIAGRLILNLGNLGIAFAEVAAADLTTTFGSMSGAASRLAGFLTPVNAALVTGAALWLAYSNAIEASKGRADDAIAKTMANFDLDTFTGFDRASAALDRNTQSARNAEHAYRGLGGAAKATVEFLNPLDDNTGFDVQERRIGFDKRRTELIRQQGHLAKNLLDVMGQIDGVQARGARSRGLTASQGRFRDLIQIQEDPALRARADYLTRWARSLGVDLSASGDKGKKAMRVVANAIEDAGRSGVIGGKAIKSGLISAEDAEAAIANWEKVRDAVKQGLAKTTDVLNTTDASAGGLTTFYKNAIDQTTGFLDNVEAALTKGFDPNLIARLLAAGPEQAGPILKTLAESSSAEFTKMVNDAEKALSDLQQRAIELARLQHIAIEGGLRDEEAKQLPTAIRIAMEKAKQSAVEGANVTRESIAAALGLTPQEVGQIAETYQIDLPNLRIAALIDSATLGQDVIAIRKKLEEIPTEITTMPRVDDPEDVRDWWEKLRAKLMEIPELRETVAKLNDPQEALVWWTLYTATIKSVPESTTTTANFVDNATAAVQALGRELSNLERTYYTKVNVSQTGAIHGGVNTQPYNVDGTPNRDNNVWTAAASGYLSGAAGHMPKVWRPGEGIRFNEKAAGGEAYIPMRNDWRRPQAVGILGQVAGTFGYGLVRSAGMYASGGGRRVSVVAPIHLNGPVFGIDHLRATMAGMVDAHVAQVERALTQGA